MGINTQQGIEQIAVIQSQSQSKSYSPEMTAYHLTSVLKDKNLLGVAYDAMFKYIYQGSVESIEFTGNLGYPRIILFGTPEFGTVSIILNDEAAIRIFRSETLSLINHNNDHHESREGLSADLEEFITLTYALLDALKLTYAQ